MLDLFKLNILILELMLWTIKWLALCCVLLGDSSQQEDDVGRRYDEKGKPGKIKFSSLFLRRLTSQRFKV